MADDQRASKRQRLNSETSKGSDGQKLSSLYRPISPPPRRSPKGPEMVKSPFQLTAIRDLPRVMNVDAVSLKNILGDPLIAECWEFNYLHDIDFLMEAFDEDVRALVKVHVVHGFWKHEDGSRKDIEVSCHYTRMNASISIIYSCSQLIVVLGTSVQVRKCCSAYGVHARNVRYSPLKNARSF